MAWPGNDLRSYDNPICKLSTDDAYPCLWNFYTRDNHNSDKVNGGHHNHWRRTYEWDPDQVAKVHIGNYYGRMNSFTFFDRDGKVIMKTAEALEGQFYKEVILEEGERIVGVKGLCDFKNPIRFHTDF